ncbi:MAG: HEPN domain-containing protein [Chloroflexota bacterium]|nr:HEPN domain-containing protein [Chloroflexota bacterium]
MARNKQTREEIIERIKAGVERSRSDVAAIVIFGSFAKGDDYRDIDLLAAVETIDKPPLDRKEEIQAIRRAVGLPLPLDVLLFSKEECRDGFQAHLPLFLDIAFDGHVVYDEGFFHSLMETTKRYVEERGIERTETGGWRFPVAHRRSTTLCALENKDWAHIWLNDAQQDMAAASNLFEAGILDKCVTHCQQTTEKAIKAVLACFGRLEKSHYVSDILESEVKAQSLGEWEDRLADLAAWARDLEPDATLSRYPGMFRGRLWIPYDQYDEVRAEEALRKAGQALDTSEAFVDWWFEG